MPSLKIGRFGLSLLLLLCAGALLAACGKEINTPTEGMPDTLKLPPNIIRPTPEVKMP